MTHRSRIAAACAALLAGLLLGGCGSNSSQTVEGADFDLDWDDGEIIVVALEDVRSFDRAVLIAPDGTEIPAFSMERDRETSTQAVQPSLGTGVSGGSNGVGVGVGLSIPLGGFDDDTSVDYRTRAQIRVPDMTAYRASWQAWELRIHQPMEDIYGERTLVLPAPEPPS
jgi:hypothetical protein